MPYRDHHQRKDLAGEHRIGDAGQIILAGLFLLLWITDTFILRYTTFLNDRVPVILRIPAAVILLILSYYLSKTGLAIVFGEKREEAEVIRKGVFGLVRHPIYLGELLLYPGLLMFSISLAAAGIWLLAILFLHYISRHEEKLLLRRFGEEYRVYTEDVPMWIPKIRSLFKKMN